MDNTCICSYFVPGAVQDKLILNLMKFHLRNYLKKHFGYFVLHSHYSTPENPILFKDCTQKWNVKWFMAMILAPAVIVVPPHPYMDQMNI
jgi:hypothetical protein